MPELYLLPVLDLESVFEQALDLILPSRRARICRFYHREDQLRSLGAGLLLRWALGVCREEELSYGPQGKPALSGKGREFSLSHSGDYAMLALSDQTVGVDLEQVREFPGSVAKGQFSEAERVWAGEDQVRLFALWTGKEAAMKWTGRGLTLPSKEIVLDPAAGTVTLPNQALFWQTGQLSGHVWSVVSAKQETAVPRLLRISDLLN